MHMRENFKTSLNDLAKENRRLQEKLKDLVATGDSDIAVNEEEKTQLEQENLALKSKLFDIMQKGGSSTSMMIETLTKENEKLRKEKLELMELSDSLLNFKG